MTIARELADFCYRTGDGPLPATVETRARHCVADHLHAAMHGFRSDTGDLMTRYLGWQGGAPTKPAAETMALFLGTISAVHEIDDVQQGTSLHPGSAVVAAALASMNENAVSGARLLRAIAAGYEVAVRLSIAAGYRHYHFFHATATCGTLGAAAAAAVILGLNAQQTAHALGIAVTSASGLWEGVNHEAVGIKHLHPGLAAERGVRAAKLAQLGLKSAEHSIEGGKGFLAALAQQGAHAPAETPTQQETNDILVSGLGEQWAISRNIFKRYPFCLGCFEPLEGLRHILGNASQRRDQVASVLVEMSPSAAWMVGQNHPQDQFQAKFSAPYALSLVLAGHDVERAPLPAALLADPAVSQWCRSVNVEANSSFPRRRARVTVTWNDGSRDSTERPFRNLDESEVWARFSRACAQYLDERGTLLENLVARCATLRDAAELAPLVKAALSH